MPQIQKKNETELSSNFFLSHVLLLKNDYLQNLPALADQKPSELTLRLPSHAVTKACSFCGLKSLLPLSPTASALNKALALLRWPSILTFPSQIDSYLVNPLLCRQDAYLKFSPLLLPIYPINCKLPSPAADSPFSYPGPSQQPCWPAASSLSEAGALFAAVHRWSPDPALAHQRKRVLLWDAEWGLSFTIPAPRVYHFTLPKAEIHLSCKQMDICCG